MSFVKGLKCRECGREYPVKLLAGCEGCFGPLEADYHYEAIAKVLKRDVIASRPKSIWKYRELLPIESEPQIGLGTGGTPLLRADRLGRKLGIDNLYLKNDAVNRLCIQIVDRYPWGFVNVNLRPFYAEGSKTIAYEVAEQLGWHAPDAIVVPMAGGAMISKIHKGFKELQRLGLTSETERTRLYGAQAAGCNPITDAVKRGTSEIRPVKPNTIAK